MVVKSTFGTYIPGAVFIVLLMMDALSEQALPYHLTINILLVDHHPGLLTYMMEQVSSPLLHPVP